ncbi:AAA domain-containing protein [Mycoplasma sp. 1012]
MNINFDVIKKNKENYKRILDNLFDVDRFDTSLFVNINDHDFMDVFKLFDQKQFEKIYTQANFRVALTENNLKKIVNEIKNASSVEEVESIFIKNNDILSAETKVKLQKDFDKENKALQSELKEKIQKNSYKWKKFLTKARSLNSERNIWPMQIGMLFVSVEIEKRKIFAPLFFKEVNIDISNSQAFLFSDGEIKINEKLIWVLEKGNYLLGVDIDVSRLSIEELEKIIKTNWSNFNIKTFKNNISKVNVDLIDNNLHFHPGMVLGIFNSFGSHQRKIMEKIIENDELDEILDVDFNKNNYKNKVNKIIFNKVFNFVKINKTNYSQDKATVSALSQNTIIWGPPGTGKSQTISNIIANIIIFDKKGLVVSQKKAALDVLKDRMNKLSIFCLFILNDNSMNKATFYKPIEKLINILENFENKSNIESLKIIYDDEKEYIDLFNKFANNENLEQKIENYSFIKKNVTSLSPNTIESLYKISKNISINTDDFKENIKKLKWAILDAKSGKKNNFFQKIFKKLTDEDKQDIEIIKKEINNFNGNLKEITDKLSYLTPQELSDINTFYEFVFENSKQDISNEEQLVNFTFYRLFKKLEKINQNKEMKKLYSKFVLAVRTKHRDPYKFVLEHHQIIKELYPIIISSVDTELSKWEKNEFDYVILDESSQIFIEKAFPILYLAKIKIFAGDDKQMQPTSWFSTRSNVEDAELGNIESILNYAVFKGVYSILLDKNYRSNYASLMTFSSKHFYNSELDVIDKFNTKNHDSIKVIQTDGLWENKINKKEAEIAIEQTKENLNKYKKIILLTFNSSQREYIENQILNNHPELEEALISEKVLLKNIENIQGDEADLLIISVVYDKTTALHTTYVSRSGGKNALNVAVSRAKDKIIVIKSLKAEEIENTNQNEDIALFKKWLLFLELTNEQRTNYLNLELKDEDESNNNNKVQIHNKLKEEIYDTFESDSFFETQKLYVKKDFSIGSQNIDLAITNEKNKILVAFTIDDYSSYNSYENYIINKDKNNFLKAKNYKIIEIKKIDWLINKETIINNIKEMISRDDN